MAYVRSVEGTLIGLCTPMGGVSAAAPNSFKVDPTKDPPNIDLTGETGKRKGQTVKGRYQIDGKTLRIDASLAEGRPRRRGPHPPEGALPW